MPIRIDDSLINRIVTRVKDDWRRTGDGDPSRAPQELQRHYVAPTIEAQQSWNAMREYAVASGAVAKPNPLKPVEPLSDKQVGKAEAALGFELPSQLRHLYLAIGDGGFGPFTGIRRLANWAKDYTQLRADGIGAKKREWPSALLPITFWNGTRFCIDRDSGKIIFWAKPLARCSQATWDQSFVPVADSLGDWLEAWVDCPTQSEGGPRGGWKAPADLQELIDARYEDNRVPRDRLVLQKPLADLPQDLLERLRHRAAETFEHGVETGAGKAHKPFDAEATLQALTSAGPLPDILKDAAANWRSSHVMQAALTRLETLGGELMTPGTRPGKGWLGPAATSWSLSEAATKLGFPLPPPLKQLYAIADGGFGLGSSGLFPLHKLVTRYRDFTSLKGPAGELWPARLLPIYEKSTVTHFLDLESGQIVIQGASGAGYDPRANQASASRWLMSPWPQHLMRSFASRCGPRAAADTVKQVRRAAADPPDRRPALDVNSER